MKEDYQQLELFSQGREPSRATPTRFSGLFMRYIRAWEKIILTIIVFVASGIVFFSLGVEKGKRISVLKTGSRLDIALKALPQPAPQQSAPAAEIKKEAPAPEKEEVQYEARNYTIQVASFTNRTSAQKEASRLKTKGMSVVVLPKGKYLIVCVGSFNKKEEAQSTLSKLKKNYQDCIVRRL